MRIAVVMVALAIGLSILAPSCSASTPTPTISCAVTFDDWNVTVTLIAISQNSVKPEDTRIILDPPDRGASLLSFPRDSVPFNDTVEITALPSTSPAIHPCLQAGDAICIVDEDHLFAQGDWMIFLIYIPTQGSMGWRAWAIGVDSLGHQQIGPSYASITSDPMTYYGFRASPPWEFTITEANLTLFLLLAYVAVLGVVAWRRLRHGKG